MAREGSKESLQAFANLEGTRRWVHCGQELHVHDLPWTSISTGEELRRKAEESLLWSASASILRTAGMRTSKCSTEAQGQGNSVQVVEIVTIQHLKLSVHTTAGYRSTVLDVGPRLQKLVEASRALSNVRMKSLLTVCSAPESVLDPPRAVVRCAVSGDRLSEYGRRDYAKEVCQRQCGIRLKSPET